MKSRYGEIPQTQLEGYKVQLHKELFWLLVYKDPKTVEQYKDVDVKKYITFLVKKLSGLNELLNCPPQLIGLMAYLEAAKLELDNTPFDYRAYRKLVLDAHSLLDELGCAHESA